MPGEFSPQKPERDPIDRRAVHISWFVGTAAIVTAVGGFLFMRDPSDSPDSERASATTTTPVESTIPTETTSNPTTTIETTTTIPLANRGFSEIFHGLGCPNRPDTLELDVPPDARGLNLFAAFSFDTSPVASTDLTVFGANGTPFAEATDIDVDNPQSLQEYIPPGTRAITIELTFTDGDDDCHMGGAFGVAGEFTP